MAIHAGMMNGIAAEKTVLLLLLNQPPQRPFDLIGIPALFMRVSFCQKGEQGQSCDARIGKLAGVASIDAQFIETNLPGSVTIRVPMAFNPLMQR